LRTTHRLLLALATRTSAGVIDRGAEFADIAAYRKRRGTTCCPAVFSRVSPLPSPASPSPSPGTPRHCRERGPREVGLPASCRMCLQCCHAAECTADEPAGDFSSGRCRLSSAAGCGRWSGTSDLRIPVSGRSARSREHPASFNSTAVQRRFDRWPRAVKNLIAGSRPLYPIEIDRAPSSTGVIGGLTRCLVRRGCDNPWFQALVCLSGSAAE
jgi:hypothetical protein